MMDKIVVTAADIEKILAWRDEHNDLVRSMPVPLREVKIQIVESGISIKCFRSDKKLKLYLDSPARKLGHVVFAPLGNGLWKKKVSTLPAVFLINKKSELSARGETIKDLDAAVKALL